MSKITGPGGDAGNASLTMRFLAGDINADGTVNAKDNQRLASMAGQSANGGNFRSDLNLNGTINSLDGLRVRSRGETTVPGGPTANTAPVVKAVASAQLINGGRRVLTLPIDVSDAESSPSALFVSVKSSNQSVIPNANIGISGGGAKRMLVLVPAPGAGGDVTLTITVSDGLGISTISPTVEVDPPADTYLGLVRPWTGVLSGASGVAMIQLAPDELSASIRYEFTNLTTPKTSVHIHGPAGAGQSSSNVLFDLTSAQLNPDGTYTWTFVPVGGLSVADIVNAIKNGQTYLDIHTTRFNTPTAEVRGQLTLATGNTAFVVPDSVPAAPTGALTDATAARFLLQSTFGPTEETINQLKSMGINAWLEWQMNMPRTSHLAKLQELIAADQDPADDNLYTEVWWNVALNGPDQLRQRVAFALSEIFVISQVDGDIIGRTQTVASYYDMLLKNAFGNYRKLLEDVTLHPAMGQYLDMRGSKKANAAGTTIPNENYPREILQLFSIGLYKLHPDGSHVRNKDAALIDAYDQDVLTGIRNSNGTYVQHGLAALFTGWNWHSPGPTPNYLDPMSPIAADHESGPLPKVLWTLDPVNPGGPPVVVSVPGGGLAVPDLAAAHNKIFEHPNTGPFICKQLIQRLVCSNPSPGYVYRVSQVFSNNGQGVRGDFRAVVKAILTDYEARSPDLLANQGFGKLKEPILRATHVMRALHVTSNSGRFRMSGTDTNLGQTPVRAPTVFNFFEPTFSYPGVLGNNGMASPEFQITSEMTAMNFANFLNDGVRNADINGTFPNSNGDVRIDITTELNLQNTSGTIAVVDRLNKILMAGQMSTSPSGGMRQSIINYIGSDASLTTNAQCTKAAIQMVATSPEFSVQK